MRGAIFDLDGTIVDNMAIHAEAFAIFVSRHGLPPLTPAARARAAAQPRVGMSS